MYRRVLGSVLLLGCTHSVTQQGPGSTSSPTVVAIDDSLRHQLLSRLEEDQRVRQRLVAKGQAGQPLDSADVAQMQTVDSLNTRWLKQLVQRQGWPRRSTVASDGANAAFVLLQHADRDTAFQVAVLPLLDQAVATGEADGQELALLTDRLSVARGQPQVYGTQADIAAGHVALKPIADSLNVDERRMRLGLPPLAVYVRLLDSVYARRPHP